ncbi:MAG TPA: GTP 3',8-cyclase MoaA [Gammaproteobacteria bacterium]|nr:GTP 3',8-cyclase MoaA [Gammaproteobacteria bacterium]
MNALVDGHGRRIDYLRVSVIDACNYRCFYCRPGDLANGGRAGLLPLGELERVIRLFIGLGVRHVRLTGGEPLLRRGLTGFVHRLAALPGLDELSLSTNGHLLERRAAGLRRAGLSRVNVSLDSLDPGRFRSITGGGDLARVLRGIEAARAARLAPVKLNMVVMRGVNDDELEAMLDFALGRGLQLRFIETMPVGQAGADSMARHVPAAAILARVRHHLGAELVPVTTGQGSGPARCFRTTDGKAGVGVISAVSRHFCATCNRVRLTARGDLVLCLGQQDRASLAALLRRSASDRELRQRILAAIARKPERHDFNTGGRELPVAQMMSLGG